jgi:polysaccharide biosynthesis transport protein
MPVINSQVLLRGLTRHWWRILLLWLVVSLPMAYLIYFCIEPTYEAFSTLRIEPTQPELFGPVHNSMIEGRAVRPYLETQVQVIASNQVLEQAVANPQVVNLPFVRQSNDPKADLRRRMSVDIVDNAYMIRVALELPDAAQAAAIVNSVVEAFLVQNTVFNRSVNKNLQENLKAQITLLEKKLEEKKSEWKTMAEQGKIKVPRPTLNPNLSSEEGSQPTFTELTETEYDRTLAQITRVDHDLIQAEAMLATLEKNAERRAMERENASRSLMADQKFEDQIKEEFNRDPEVVALSDEIGNARDHLERAKSSTRSSADPAVVIAHKHIKKLQEQWNDLWQDKYPEIQKRLLHGENGDRVKKDAEAITALKLRIDALKQERAGFAKMLEIKVVENNKTNADNFNAMMLKHDLGSILSKMDSVSRNLDQLKFEAEQDTFRVILQDSAAVPKIASNNKRVKYMAAAPLGILFLMLGFFLVLEVRAERVGDPDSLSTRVRSEVFALPPLPTSRSMRTLPVSDTEDQVEQFIQRLDHLRFAVCGNASELGKGRSVLITSAVCGEGKTTLAAQLALRCGNAGVSTLLIDADLRRASLCALLDVPEGPGLGDVLQDEATVDQAIIPIQGGTFYLLPAGNAISDPSRVLQNRKFEELLARLRQLYDLVIIDSPPVLPVPDALIMGRFADGAVLAARYDKSRFPQVERARRELDRAGIAILGTVINGMRNSDAYYGRYTYRRRPSPSDSSNTI